ncbi:FIST signal transduction protein [Flavobacterium sp. KACC 22763]|uniref:FIST signal transduction protein n=1 Tax=Flavobacterium sp. KACC 22763 TaxID=3025668 RepID=UPI0023654A0C|nr:FIST N-terminal domain-containing protein [Flavobacterium sp. KACC 22763]WDF65990.1 FIST C-terminal domain-containing protein [Flavobacterium sp. KACC 22763]
MKTASILFEDNSFKKEFNNDNLDFAECDLVLGFGSRDLLADGKIFTQLRKRFPSSELVLCSSAGEIYGHEVLDNTISLTAIKFSSTQIKTCEVDIADFENSFQAGSSLIRKFSQNRLKLILILSDGGKVNGSELANGMNSVKEEQVLIVGGLAGDGAKFEKTIVGLNRMPEQGKIIAIGFYGEKLLVSHGSLGGWESFGLERLVTKAEGNVLYEIDGRNVLDLYKIYLGKYAEELPGSALLFPLSIKIDGTDEPIVRTILSIDEKNQTMTFAGDVPTGSRVRFMKANFDRLIDAASEAALSCLQVNSFNPKLALLISCVGRKLILGSRIDEEVEAVSEIFGNTAIAGFYSYGEISPLKPFGDCILHNQTMTITCINEMN